MIGKNRSEALLKSPIKIRPLNWNKNSRRPKRMEIKDLKKMNREYFQPSNMRKILLMIRKMEKIKGYETDKKSCGKFFLFDGILFSFL
jgi:hypothetical protein